MGRITVDYETTGFDSYAGDRVFSYSLTTEDGRTDVCRLDLADRRQARRNRERLHDTWADKTVEKVAHNSIFEREFTISEGVHIPKGTVIHDTMLIARMVYNLFPTYKLAVLARRMIGLKECEGYDRWDREVRRHMQMQKRVFKKLPTKKYGDILKALREDGIEPMATDRPNYGLIPRSIMEPYQVADGERETLLMLGLWPQLEEMGPKTMESYRMELDVVTLSERMQRFGILYDPKEGERLREWLEGEVGRSTRECLEVLGKDINLDSPAQLGRVLFDELDYPVLERSEKTGDPSTSSDVLKKLKEMTGDKVFDALIRYRAYKNGLESVAGYADLVGEGNIIHPDMNTMAAKTFRQSISRPSLQNTSKAVAAGVTYSVPARKCFRTRPGAVILAPDYSGIELRLIIAQAGEQELIDRIKEDNEFDLHSLCADVMLTPEWRKEPDPARRYKIRAAQKTYDFGKPYGGKFKTVAADLLEFYPRSFLMEGERRFAARWPKVFNFSSTLEDEIYARGYITTPLGKRLHVHEAYAFRSANYDIQCVAGEILKRGEVNLERYFQEEWSDDIRMLFSVHDELLIHCPRAIWAERRNKVRLFEDMSRLMTTVPEIDIPLTIEFKLITTNWAAGRELSREDIYAGAT